MKGKFFNKRKGGLTLNLILFMTFLVFFFYINGFIDSNNSEFNRFVTTNSSLGIVSTIYNSNTGVFGLITLLGGTGLLIGTIFFPNKFTLTGGIFAIGLGIIIGGPNEIFSIISTYLPTPFNYLAIIIFAIIGFMAWLSWYVSAGLEA